MPPSHRAPASHEADKLGPGYRISEEYVMGNKLGGGASGFVFECQNQFTGELFAVKTIKLRRLKPEVQRSLEQEIEVLKAVHHPNIVKYIATVQSRNHLHIIMQYMEKGSLTKCIQSFGVFPPGLAALFTRQVLQGLAYLHGQGVIHRDIKGDNILLDKTGRVKLADFGIAVRAGQALTEEDLGAGTAYWMAPEVIQMHPATTACDIWSVGCTAIEMLTGKPPYMELREQQAIFRIVEVKTMPIPQDLPAEVTDFLNLCFIREPTSRPTAKSLLLHKWILSSVGTKDGSSMMSSDVETIEGSSVLTSPGMTNSTATSSVRTTKLSITSRGSLSSHGSQPIVGGKPQRHSLPGQVYDSVTFDEAVDWSNFPQGPSQLKAVGEHEAEYADDASASSPPRSVSVSPMLTRKELQQMPSSAESPSNNNINNNNNNNSMGKNTSSNSKKVAIEEEEKIVSTGKLLESKKLNKLAKYQEKANDDDFFKELDLPKKLERNSMQADSLRNVLDALTSASIDPLGSPRGSNSAGKREAAMALVTDLVQIPEVANKAADKLIALMEDSPVLRKTLISHTGVSPLLDILNSPWESVNQPKHQQQFAVLKVLNEAASSDRAELEVLLMAGIVPPLTRLCGKSAALETRRVAASLTAQFLQTSPVTLHMFVACGGSDCLVALLEPSSPSPSSSTTNQANTMMTSSSTVNPVGLNPNSNYTNGPPIELGLIALDGVERLFAETLAPPGSHRRASFSRAADAGNMLPHSSGHGAAHQSSMSPATAVSKNDFCSLFARTLLLDRLARFGDRLQTEEGRKESRKCGVAPLGVLAEVCHVLTVFSRGGQVAKLYLAHSRMALRFVLTTLARRWASAISTQGEDEVDDDDLDSVRALLNCLQNLSSEVSCLEALDAAGAIPALVPFLAVRKEVLQRKKLSSVVLAAVNEVHNLAMVIIFYLVRMSTSRQEKAAACGLAGLAVHAAIDRTPVKPFAMQILVEMCSSTEFVRSCMFKEGAVDFLLDALIGPDVLWQDRSLQALAQLLLPSYPSSSQMSPGSSAASASSTTRSQIGKEIELHMLRPGALRRLVQLFQAARSEQFESVARTFVQMLEASPKLAEAIGRSGVSVAEICARLSYPKAEVRIDLVRLLGLIAGRHTDLESLLLDHNLFSLLVGVQQSAKQSKLVVLASHTEQLLAAWRPVLDRICNS